ARPGAADRGRARARARAAGRPDDAVDPPRRARAPARSDQADADGYAPARRGAASARGRRPHSAWSPFRAGPAVAVRPADVVLAGAPHSVRAAAAAVQPA